MSYFFLLYGLLRIAYASDILLNISVASSLPAFLSGCHFKASFLYAYFISAAGASFVTPSK